MPLDRKGVLPQTLSCIFILLQLLFCLHYLLASLFCFVSTVSVTWHLYVPYVVVNAIQFTPKYIYDYFFSYHQKYKLKKKQKKKKRNTSTVLWFSNISGMIMETSLFPSKLGVKKPKSQLLEVTSTGGHLEEWSQKFHISDA